MGKRIIAAAVALLALTGCASTAVEAEPKPTVTFPEVEESTGTTLTELRDLYIASGGDCDTLRPRTGSRVAEEAADCEDGALLTIYESEAQRDGAIRVLEGIQEITPSPHVIVVGPDWIVNGSHVEGLADAMGGVAQQIGTPVPEVEFDLTTDAGICAADAELTNLELNDVLAPVLGYPADRDQRTFEQDEAIRAYKNAAFQRECPERAF